MKTKEKEREFTQLVQRLKGAITSVCMMYADERTPVDDLVQESLINIWKGFDTFQGRSDIRTWVYRVALNTCITIDRKQKRRREKEARLKMDINLYEDNDADTRQVKKLYERINRLGVFDRAIVLLWLEGLPYDEIGQIVGISSKNVSVKLVRIREELKNMNN